MTIDLVSKLDEELSSLLTGQNALQACPIVTYGIVHVHDQLVLANSPLGVHASLDNFGIVMARKLIWLNFSSRGRTSRARSFIPIKDMAHITLL
jgi:hypothetical protein